MPYQQLIPRPTDQLNVSQGDIQANFLEIYNWVAVNHGQFDSPISGLHTQVTLPENAAPTPTAIDQANIYSRLSPLTAQTELAWQRENNGSVIEWTGLLAATTGWTRLPSGILLKWGQAASAGFNSAVVFPVAANTPVFANVFTVFTVVTSATISASQLVPGSVTNLGFSTSTWQAGALGPFPVAVNIYYLAIGT